jgi:protein TonB
MMFIYKHSMATLLLFACATAGLHSQQDDKVYKVGDPGVVAPLVKYSIQPGYTDEAQAQAIMGTVVIALEIDKDGKPRNAKVIQGLDASLDKNALAALNQWLFQPAMLDGEPVVCNARIEIRFALQ